MSQVIVIIGAGGIGVAIARRQGIGKTLLLADFDEAVLSAAADQLRQASYTVETQTVDVSSRKSVAALVERAASLGSVMQVVNTAGLSPNMAPPEREQTAHAHGLERTCVDQANASDGQRRALSQPCHHGGGSVSQPRPKRGGDACCGGEVDQPGRGPDSIVGPARFDEFVAPVQQGPRRRPGIHLKRPAPKSVSGHTLKRGLEGRDANHAGDGGRPHAAGGFQNFH
jgi:hypothetical protein